jgi:hypothetical protein
MTAESGVTLVLTLLFGGGCWCVWWAVSAAWRTARRDRQGTVVPARIVALERVSGSDGDPLYVSVAQFTDRAGQVRRVKSKSASSPAAHAVGQDVFVSYAPDDVTDAEIVHQDRWLIAVGLFGLVLAAIALLIVWNIHTGAMTIH